MGRLIIAGIPNQQGANQVALKVALPKKPHNSAD